MSATAASLVPTPTEPRRLDELVSRLREGAPRWVRASLHERMALARSMLAGAVRVAARSVAASCDAKGIPLDTPEAGEEWVAGPWIVVRMLRQYLRSLEGIARAGNTPLGKLGETSDGRLTARVFPATRTDALLLIGVQGEVQFAPGMTARDVDERRARFYKAPDHGGKVCLVLGAGNINSIPPFDVATKLFNEGKVCLLKMNPVNAYLGPLYEEAFAEAIARGWLAVAYGGAHVGEYLAQHPGIDEVHITGAKPTHDTIVWGPPGPEREARRSRGEPVLKKPITSELGCVSPVLVVPGRWDRRTLRAQAEAVAGMVTFNGAYNCTSARVLVLPRRWEHRDAFLDQVANAMSRSPTRRPWYPGAVERWHRFTVGRSDVRTIGDRNGRLPWTLVAGVDADSRDEAFEVEPFVPVLFETSVGGPDPLAYLEAAVPFANERLEGTLTAHLLVPPASMRDAVVSTAVRGAIQALRYGTVSVNGWAGGAFAFGTAPWGGAPGATLANAESGVGWAHDTLMLEGVEKVVAWNPAVPLVKMPNAPGHRTAHLVGERLFRVEARGSLLQLPGLAAAAIRG
jgi:aldehyde dehydrogenase (NAD(P)+)